MLDRLITGKMKTKLFLLFTYLHFCVSLMQGQQWLNITPSNYESSKGFFIDKKKGWICGRTESNNYTLLKTDNGGESFEEIYSFSEADIGFYRIQMIDTLIGYGTVWETDTFLWKTLDGGISWENATDTSIMSNNGPLYYSSGLFFQNSDTGFYGGLNSIYKTINGGGLWTKMITPDPLIDTLLEGDYIINEIYFHNANRGWAACSHIFDAGFGMKTIDGGENWEICTPTGSTDMWDVHFINNVDGGIVGRNAFYSHVYLTEDNFNAFSLINQAWDLQYGQFAETICYQNDSIIWISGTPAKLIRSTDRGLTFAVFQNAEVPGITDPHIFNIQFFENTGYAIGNGFLLKFEDSLGNNISRKETNEGNINVWPNPTNDNIYIQIKSSEPEKVTVTLFSIEGTFKAKINSVINPGINRITFNIGNKTPGIYLLTIEGDKIYRYQKIIKR